MDSRVKKFITDLKQQCKQHNVKIRLSKKKFVKDKATNFDYLGYFGEDERNGHVLVCALGDLSSVFVAALVHESCHMDQWIEKTRIWETSHSYQALELWVEGCAIKNIAKHIENVKELELDCEKRTVKKILDYGLPVDIEAYIRRANMDIQLFNYIEQKRKWPSNSFASLSDTNLWKHFPKKFREKKYYESLSRNAEKVFEEYKVCE